MGIDSEIKYTYENIYDYHSYSKYIILFLILIFIYILVSLRKYN